MEYSRFHIPTKEAPHLYSTPSKFDVSAKKLRLAAMLLHEAVHYRFDRKVVLSRPCIYGVFSGRLGGFKPVKSKCVGCMRCVQEYPHIMTVKHSDAYKMLGDSYWTPEAVLTILYESSTGKIPIKGMGYKGGFGGDGWDGIWTDMSEIVRPTRDGVYGREYISTSVDIGRKPPYLDFNSEQSNELANRTVQSPLPIIFDLLPDNNVTELVEEGVAEAAAKLGLYRLTKSQHPKRNEIPVVEDEEEIPAEARIVCVGQGHGTMRQLQEETHLHPSQTNSLMMARVRLDDNAGSVASRLARKGVGIIYLTADYHGQDYSNTKRHVSQAVRTVHSRLVKDGTRDLVTLVAGGGITLAEHVPKAIIYGADLVAVDTTLLIALQSQFKGEARDRTDCMLEPRKVEPEWAAQRLVNLMAAWHDQLIEILSAMGMRDVRRLRGDIGRSMTDSELREQAFEDIVKA